MRGLKFRAWNTGTKEWSTTLKLKSNGHLEDLDFDSEGVYRFEPEPDQYVVELYTGLKDKNGKEIYEGDIIKICRSYGYGFLPKGAMAIVFYDENECCYKLQKQGEFRLTKKKIVEVIGNIHENPELLDVKEEG